VNPQTKEFYFLETNPRLQVEHTLTETILDIDLVKAQLLIAQGATLAGAGLPSSPNPLSPPTKFACQLRVTAEDVSKNWSLSIGKITSISLPGGNGVRVDQALTPGHVVGSSFDSLLAKIIVSGPTWDTVVRKAQRALNETAIEGVTTNLAALRGIVAHPDFAARDCDTTWLETHQVDLLRLGSQPPRLAQLPSASPSSSSSSSSSASSNVAAIASGPPLFRRGDAWTVTLTPIEDNKTDKPGTSAASSTTTTTHLSLSRIQRNHFPTELIGDVEVTTSSAATGSTTRQQYQLTLQATSSSASAVTSQHRRGNAADPRHVVIPMPGKLVEVCVDEGDVLREGDVVCVVQQMKMEIEIRAKHAGRVVWVTEVEDGEEVSEGILAAEIELLEEKEVVATTTAAAKL
jgi:acetyl/propionyl-CoA carboxylase alpha subunit